MEELELKVQKEVKAEDVEELVKESKSVTDEKIEASLNYDMLSQEEKDAIDEFNKNNNTDFVHVENNSQAYFIAE